MKKKLIIKDESLRIMYTLLAKPAARHIIPTCCEVDLTINIYGRRKNYKL